RPDRCAAGESAGRARRRPPSRPVHPRRARQRRRARGRGEGDGGQPMKRVAEIPPNHLVHLVDFDGGDEDQRRPFFSRRSLALTPRAMPRYARNGRSGTRKITPPLSRTVIRIPGRSRRRSRAPRGRTSWYLLERVTVSIVLLRSYRWSISK